MFTELLDKMSRSGKERKVTLRVLEGNGKKEELKLVTFDKKMYEFSKKNNVMYDEEIYNKFLTEIK